MQRDFTSGMKQGGGSKVSKCSARVCQAEVLRRSPLRSSACRVFNGVDDPGGEQARARLISHARPSVKEECYPDAS